MKTEKKNEEADTLDKNGSSTVTTLTSEGSNPISSFASLVAVSPSSLSPSSAFPPGNATSPATKTHSHHNHQFISVWFPRKWGKETSPFYVALYKSLTQLGLNSHNSEFRPKTQHKRLGIIFYPPCFHTVSQESNKKESPTELTRVSGQPRRPLGENHAQIPTISFKETDQNCGSLGSKPFWVLRNWGSRLRKTQLGNHFPSAFFEALLLNVLEGRRRLVEAELLGQGDKSLRASEGAGRVHALIEWGW